ncbi:MAG: Hsp70 family protein [Deltaproteobacteria bacterium]|nr:Hsp70 family protein [Deltaproteobacteria bacterium]
MTTKIEDARYALQTMKETPATPERVRILDAVRSLPQTPDCFGLYKTGYELIHRIEDANERNIAILDFHRLLPLTEAFLQLYSETCLIAIAAADALPEAHHRTTELLRLAKGLPTTRAFHGHRIHAWRLALDLPDAPRYAEPDLRKIGKALPKANDYTFYRRYTLMGVLSQMPQDEEYCEVYQEALALAIRAVETIAEPYYRKYALIYVANDLWARPDRLERLAMYKDVIRQAHEAATLLSEPLAKMHALTDLLKTVPKEHEFFDALQSLLAESLSFFTVKNWVRDIDPVDVVDYILSAEEHGISDSKQRRFDREKYAAILSREVEKISEAVSDIRLIETLKPYNHVWVQPRQLREAVKKAVDRLEALKGAYHGKEVCRPVFVAETHPGGAGRFIHKRETGAEECISIDLGATNTVIMRKKGSAPPDYLFLPAVSRVYDGVSVIPTILSAETNAVGAEVVEDYPVMNIKQMLLDHNPNGARHMERFFRLLWRHVKKAASTGGWFSLGQGAPADVVYMTVPVGHQEYRKILKEIAEKTANGVKIEFLEEPLAAAIGYQVVEQRDKLIMVIDFGGSTLNTMCLRVNADEAHVVAKPDRAKLLGGRDIDEWLAEHLASKAGITGVTQHFRFLSAAEEMKITLSKEGAARLSWEGTDAYTLTRADFEQVLEAHDFYKLVDRAISNLLRHAQKVGIKKEAIEAVLLTGGSSQIPSFKDKVGSLFPLLRDSNMIFDHSPLSAVAHGAALYGTRDITDRHLGMAYAIRYAVKDGEKAYSYSIVLEKGELLPLEKTFRLAPAMKLGTQKEASLELFEVPESLVSRVWVIEEGIEYLKQEFKQVNEGSLNPLKTITLTFREPLKDEFHATFSIDGNGHLSVKYGQEVVDAGVRLQ